MARLIDGSLSAATMYLAEREVRLEAFGRRAPRSVLVTVSTSGLSREAASLASHAGGLLQLLDEASAATGNARAHGESARVLRFAVLTALMTGDVTLVRRMTGAAPPPLLEADSVRVHLLHCPPDDRERLVRTYQDASGYHGAGLMVRCPAFEDHLICPIAEDAGPGDPLRGGEVLRELVRDNPDYALGVSRAHPLAATGAAYSESLHALAVARNSHDRLAVYSGRPSLVRVLPQETACAWSRAVVAPLHAEPKLTMDIIRLAVTFPRSAVARLLNLSRTTVVAHCRRAERALDRDLGQVRVRAELDLALSLDNVAPGPAVAQQATPTFDELLTTPAAMAWAATFLHPLTDPQRSDLDVTARAWIDHNTDAQRTAEALSLSRNTVRSRLRAVERLLNRDLLTTGSGVHDLVHALTATGHRAQPGNEGGHRAPWPRRHSST
ncbi:helix-turn-helix domain-containing protein [Streptomyces sp. NPDC020489]|uniref:helix-turn-helix domain-containing protein n=1 Tax=Streptomyces sp. NPDC020489 TaxID=3365077 RepID=UPI0037BB99CC